VLRVELTRSLRSRNGGALRNLVFDAIPEVAITAPSGRRTPILQRFASESAELIAGNKMALNVERIMDGGVNGQEPPNGCALSFT
jgi:hypothetical protein